MENSPIAITGISCRFANAGNPRAFWRLLIGRHTALRPLEAHLARPIGAVPPFNAPYPGSAATLGPLYACRPFEQSFPRQINAGENQDLYFITQLAFDALADAGLRPRPNPALPPRRATIRLAYAPLFTPSLINWLDHTFFIDQTLDVLRRYFPGATDDHLAAVRSRLRESLPAVNADALLTATGQRIADWIAREAALDGAATALDGGVLSGISALEAAMDDLRTGRADMALAGAVSPPLCRALLEGLAGKITFSEDSELHPFDRDANGTLPGEGGAFLVLKRRADALAAHDRIYALVRESVTAAGVLPIAACAEAAQAPLSTIAMIEADGAGFPEMDVADIETVQRLWGAHHPGGALVGIGSVKGNIGHCFTAASAAAIVKVAQALHVRVLPPQVTVPHPIERLANVSSPAYLLEKARPWITGNPALPRRAIVCADDFDGRRAAVLMEEEPEDRR